MNLQATLCVMIQYFTYTSERGHPMGLSLYDGGLPAAAPTIVYLHGFKGFKDWGFVPYIGARLVAAGMRLLTLNFSHNGVHAHSTEFTELGKFRANTFSLELEEALEVIGKYHAGQLFGVEAGTRIGLLGHSRGGGIALLAAGHPAIRCVCTWAGVSTFARYPQQTIDFWQRQGYLDATNARTGQVMQIDYNLHRDLMAHLPGKLDIEAAVRALAKPLCIVHGDADEAVADADAQAIFEWADQAQAELHLIPGAGHTFGAKHPFEQSHPHLEDALNYTLQFFTSHLHNEI
jgi:dienelactone hydrolase